MQSQGLEVANNADRTEGRATGRRKEKHCSDTASSVQYVAPVYMSWTRMVYPWGRISMSQTTVMLMFPSGMLGEPLPP